MFGASMCLSLCVCFCMPIELIKHNKNTKIPKISAQVQTIRGLDGFSYVSFQPFFRLPSLSSAFHRRDSISLFFGSFAIVSYEWLAKDQTNTNPRKLSARERER